MSFQPNTIRTLQKIRASQKNLDDSDGERKEDYQQEGEEFDDKLEQLYDVLDKKDNDKIPKSSYSVIPTPKSQAKELADFATDNQIMDQIDSRGLTQSELLEQIMNGQQSAPPRTPVDVKSRSQSSKWTPNQLEELVKKREEYEQRVKEDPNANYSYGQGDAVDDDNDGMDHAYSQYLMNEAEELLDNDVLGPRGFLNNIYQNDQFMQMKSQLENDLIENTKLEVERKHMISDADQVLADLKRWKEEREDNLKEHKLRKDAEEEEFNNYDYGDENQEDQQIDTQPDGDQDFQAVRQKYEDSMAQFRSIHTIDNLKNQIPMNEKKELSDIKHIKNEATAKYINSKLLKHEHKLNYIQTQIHQEKKPFVRTTPQETNQELLDMTHQNKEHMIESMAKFEDDIQQFDQELSDIINEKPSSVDKTSNNNFNKSQPSSDDNPNDEFEHIDKLLGQLKIKGENAQIEEKAKQIQINQMMLDIDNEFDEIDSLLRDVESMKIENDPNHNEHQEEHRTNNNAPTD